MAYVACQPCNFAGQSFRIGETIPVELVQPGAAKRLIKMGRIAEMDGETASETPTTETKENTTEIVVHGSDGDMSLNVTTEGLQAIFDVLGGVVGDAEAIIEQMTDEDALILLHVSDSRKSIKELAFNRADALTKEAEGE